MSGKKLFSINIWKIRGGCFLQQSKSDVFYNNLNQLIWSNNDELMSVNKINLLKNKVTY